MMALAATGSYFEDSTRASVSHNAVTNLAMLSHKFNIVDAQEQ